MAAVRVLAWMHPAGSIAPLRRPSWMAPPAPIAAPISTRPRLSIVPSVKSPSIAPPPASKPRPSERPAPDSMRIRERAAHEETVRALHAEIDTLRGTTAQLAQTLATMRRHVLEASEGELVKLALVIAQRVVGLELTANPEQLVTWAKEAIATLPAHEQLVVAISTDLADELPKSAWANITSDRHTLEVDHRLPPGTCEVRTSATSVEVSAAARMEAVSETIGAIS